MHLEDICRYAADAVEIAQGRTFEQYIAEKEFRYATERCFEVIGEALTRIKKTDPTVAQSLTEWRKIIRFRNVLIHGCDEVSEATTWSILCNKLPILIAEARALFLKGGGHPDDLPPS